MHKVFNFDQVQLNIFPLLLVLWVSHLRNHDQISCHEAFPACFILREFHSFRYSIHFEIIVYVGQGNHSYVGGYSVFLTICWEDSPFPIEWFWHPCWKSCVLMCVGSFLGSPFYLLPLSHCFDCCRFVTGLKSENVTPPTFFKIVLAIQCSSFHIKFRINFSISEENSISILTGIVWNL